ncbi:MAG: hypothetical protein EXR77_15335 [Myxococcales bacterium]|nr:hypothetical protein [Myxococcales bacterium]
MKVPTAGRIAPLALLAGACLSAADSGDSTSSSAQFDVSQLQVANDGASGDAAELRDADAAAEIAIAATPDTANPRAADGQTTGGEDQTVADQAAADGVAANDIKGLDSAPDAQPDAAQAADQSAIDATTSETGTDTSGSDAPAAEIAAPTDTAPVLDTAQAADAILTDTAPATDVGFTVDTAVADTAKADVAPAVVCGNAKCEAGETCAACPKDCGCAPATVCSNAKCVSNWPPAPMPAECAFAAKVLTYNPKGWSHLADAMAADPAPCADYFIHLPAIAGDKTQPRGNPALVGVHALGGRFHAMAEFHWGGWWDVAGMSWLQKGKEFRKRMTEKGYVPGRDHWAINELPSTVRTDKAVRQAVRDVVQGLYEGPAGAPAMGGAVYIIGMGQSTQNFNVYKPAMKDWTLDAGFWQDMNAYVKWWGQEVYGDPATVCVGAATVAARSEAVNVFAMHHARLADVGPAGAAAAGAFFDESYTPLGSAAWNSDVFNTNKLTLDQMKHFASTQVYAARAWAAANKAPDERIALAWNDQLDGATVAQVQELAARVASALRYAYDKGGPAASKACSPSGAFTWCGCAVAGAAFNPLWKTTFAAW